MGYYIDESFEIEYRQDGTSDYSYLNGQMTAAVTAYLANDASYDTIRNQTLEDRDNWGSYTITSQEYDSYVSDAIDASAAGEFSLQDDGTLSSGFTKWNEQRTDEHFIDKTSLKDTRDLQYVEELDAEGQENLTQGLAEQNAAGNEIGSKMLEDLATMADSYIPVESWDYDNEAQVADRIRWSEQCYLVNHIEPLADLHKQYIRDYQYVDVIDGPPSQFMNRLFHQPFSGDFVDITPGDASELTPLFRLYKVIYDWKTDDDGGHSTELVEEVPIIFEKMAREDLLEYAAGTTAIDSANIKIDGEKVTQPNNIGAGKHGMPGVGYSWDKFEWSYIGSNPATIKNDITATLVLSFQDFNQLARIRVHQPDPSFGKQKPDPIAYSLLDLLGYGSHSYKRLPDNADEYHEKFYEIKAVCGWQPHDFRGHPEKEKLRRAIENQRVVLYLTLVDHEFDINDLGTFTLRLNYRARLESLMTDPKVDILAKAEHRTELADINKKIESLKRQCDVKGVDEERDKYYEVIEKHRGTDLNDILRILMGARGPLFQRTTRKRHSDLPPGVLLDPAAGKGKTHDGVEGRIYMVNPTVDELASFATGGWTRASSASAEPNVSLGAAGVSATLYSDIEALSSVDPNTGETTFDADDPLASLQKISADEEVSPDNRARVPYFYFGDLVEIVADKALSEDYFQTGEITSLTPDEANRVKIILGPYSFYNGMEEKRINLADIPISVRSFTDFWYKNVVAKPREKYLLLHFIRDIIDQLVIEALGAECFAFNGHPLGPKPVRLRTAFLTLPPKSTPDSSVSMVPDPLLELDSEAYAASDEEGWGTIKLERINELQHTPGSSILGPEPANVLRNPTMEESLSVDAMNHYLVVFAESTSPWDLKGDEEDDYEKGIFHLKIHQGILHQARFKKTDQPYLREARYQKTGRNPLVHLSNVYQVSLSMLGNTLFYPGSYVFINPLGFGTSLGEPQNHEGPSLSNVMGLGGYHFIIDVTNTIDKNFTTSMGVRWDNNGAGSVRSVEYPTRKNEEEDCSE